MLVSAMISFLMGLSFNLCAPSRTGDKILKNMFALHVYISCLCPKGSLNDFFHFDLDTWRQDPI